MLSGACRERRSPDCAQGRFRRRQSRIRTRLASPAKPSPTDATLVGVAVLSPVTDLTLSGATYDTRADADPFFTRPQVEALVHSYLGSADAKHPLASPLHSHLAGMPSAFMSVTTKCCWTIRFDISVVQLPQASMPGSTCGWACRTGFPEASEDLRRQRKRWMPSVLSLPTGYGPRRVCNAPA